MVCYELTGGDCVASGSLQSTSCGPTDDGCYMCGIEYCDFVPGECYILQTDGSFDGSMNVSIPGSDPNCMCCNTYLGNLQGYNGDTSLEFCFPEECSEGTTQESINFNSYSGGDNASWTLTNLISGTEVISGDFNGPTPFICLEDGVFELSVCDYQDDMDDFWVDICSSGYGPNSLYM